MERLFGSSKQTKVLVLIGMLEVTYPLQLARLSGSSRTSVEKFLDRLEEDGIIVSIREGRNRNVSISPRFRSRQTLVPMLKQLGASSPEIQQALMTLRRRPRKRGKPIWPQT
jgi:hypothetical protein